MKSSIQSVAGQPVASPDSMPAHHGLTSPCARDLVAEGLQVVQGLGDLVARVGEHAGRVPDERLDVRAERRAVELAVDGAVGLPVLGPAARRRWPRSGPAAGFRSPLAANRCSRPGWGKNAMSGALPPSTRTLSWASNSPEPSYEMSMPVQSVNSRPRLLEQVGLGVADGRVDADLLAVEGAVVLERGAVAVRAAAAATAAAAGVATGSAGRQGQHQSRGSRRSSQPSVLSCHTHGGPLRRVRGSPVPRSVIKPRGELGHKAFRAVPG